MTKRNRTFLFSILALLFVIIAPSVILYSQGYRFDFETKRLTRVGAFYFDVQPTRAEIFVNAESIGRTARILGSAFTGNFIPGTYHVAIVKERFYTWEKTLEIFPKQVTEAKHIILFPENPAFLTLTDDVENFWFAPNGKEALLQKKNSRNSWTLSLWDAERSIDYPLFEPVRIQDEIWNIEWASDSDSFVLQVVSQEQIQSFIQQIDRESLTSQRTRLQSLQAASAERISLDFLDSGSEQISLSPFHSDRIIFLNPKINVFELTEADYITAKVLEPIDDDVIAFTVSGQNLIWIDSLGNLWQKENINSDNKMLASEAHVIKAETAYTLEVFTDEIFLKDRTLTYKLDKETNQFKEFSSANTQLVISPDHTKLLVSYENEISIFYLKDQFEQPKHAKNEQVFLTRLSKPILHTQWLNNQYITFTVDDQIYISEIDDRDRLNVVPIGSFPKPAIYWESNQDVLYVRSNEEIKVSESLIP